MEEFPGNSKKVVGAKPEKKLEKVVTGEVIQKKRSIGRRFKDVFFGGEFKSVARYVSADVLLPALRNLIVDSATKGVERMVYGESSVTRRRHPDFRSRVSYNLPINRPRDPRERSYLPDQPPFIPKGARHQVDDIILRSREEAESVLEMMGNAIEKYDIVSVADLNDLLGFASPHTDNKWGWVTLSGASIRQVKEGWLLDLPRAEPIE